MSHRTHLSTADGTKFCSVPSRTPTVTSDTAEVDCNRCLGRLRNMYAQELWNDTYRTQDHWQDGNWPPKSWVYFVHIGDYIKIGFSANPDSRAYEVHMTGGGAAFPRFRMDGELFYPSREPFHGLIHTIQGGYGTEQAIHRALVNFRVQGEWFLAEPELIAWARQQRKGGPFEELPRLDDFYDYSTNPGEVAEREAMRSRIDAAFASLTSRAS